MKHSTIRKGRKIKIIVNDEPSVWIKRGNGWKRWGRREYATFDLESISESTKVNFVKSV